MSFPLRPGHLILNHMNSIAQPKDPHTSNDCHGSRGVIVIIVPLLVLPADQMIKIKVALQDFGSVEAHNLDDLSSHNLCDGSSKCTTHGGRYLTTRFIII